MSIWGPLIESFRNGREKEKRESVFTCPYDGQTFKGKYRFSLHMKTSHFGKPQTPMLVKSPAPVDRQK